MSLMTGLEQLVVSPETLRRVTHKPVPQLMSLPKPMWMQVKSQTKPSPKTDLLCLTPLM